MSGLSGFQNPENSRAAVSSFGNISSSSNAEADTELSKKFSSQKTNHLLQIKPKTVLILVGLALAGVIGSQIFNQFSPIISAPDNPGSKVIQQNKSGGLKVESGLDKPAELSSELGADSFTVLSSQTIVVHVAGEVKSPGVYFLADSSRLIDAISAAGGFTPEAKADGINLARLIRDGEQLIVPNRKSKNQNTAEAAGNLININTAGLAELDKLPKIGPALAQRIISWRESNGGFQSLSDLLKVSGIGPAVLSGLRDKITY